jgi:hypothetical protein
MGCHQLHTHVGWVYQISKKGILQGNPTTMARSMRLEIATGNTDFPVAPSINYNQVLTVQSMQVANCKTSFTALDWFSQ